MFKFIEVKSSKCRQSVLLANKENISTERNNFNRIKSKKDQNLKKAQTLALIRNFCSKIRKTPYSSRKEKFSIRNGRSSFHFSEMHLHNYRIDSTSNTGSHNELPSLGVQIRNRMSFDLARPNKLKTTFKRDTLVKHREKVGQY